MKNYLLLRTLANFVKELRKDEDTFDSSTARGLILTFGNQRNATGKKNPNIVDPKVVLLAMLKKLEEGSLTLITHGTEDDSLDPSPTRRSIDSYRGLQLVKQNEQ